ncbi:MAG: glycosyltransferase [Deltaproteobacteria bacterium]|nr:glycosyltransferase [Deltaproteobacteria bacterium]
MRVLFISDTETRGGAAIAASRLARGLSEAGVEVERLYAIRSSEAYTEPAPWRSSYAGLPRALEVGLNGVARRNVAIAKTMAREVATRHLRQAIESRSFDILHVHAIHNSSWNHKSLASISPDLPTVWTFHDYWGFSPESYLFRDATGHERRLKPDGVDRRRAMDVRKAYFTSRRRLALAGNSRDTSRLASASLGMAVETIPYGLPLDLYRPLERTAARSVLDLANNFIIGFSSDLNTDPIKGMGVLKEALSRLPDGFASAVAMGSARAGDEIVGSVPLRTLGRIDNPRLQSIVYSAADVFVVPSLAEAMGQVAMEAIACGTPVVASDVGGLPDAVIPDRSGWLFPAGNVAALAERLDKLMRMPAHARDLRGTCRRMAEENWAISRQAHDYIRLYQRLLFRS